MRVCLLLRRRWRMVLWLLLVTIFMFDAVVFIGIQNFKARTLAYITQSDESSNYLQMARKRLTMSRSNLSRSSVDLDNSGGVFEHNMVNVNISRRLALTVQTNNLHQGHNSSGEVSKIDKGRFHNLGVGANGTYHSIIKDVVRLSLTTKLTQGQGYGARSNYSLSEVDKFVTEFQEKYKSTHFSVGYNETYSALLKRLKILRKRGSRLPMYINNRGEYPWERFHYGIHQHFLYDPDDLGTLMHYLGTTEIISVEQKEGGTQMKLIITFEDQGQALFKPMRYTREQETLPDHFYFADFERHNAEIAAFHLDILLGFHRVPPTIGRLLNVSDIESICDSKLAKTFFVSPAGNLCFHGSCSYYCDSSHPICGHPLMLEGSLAVFLPSTHFAKRQTWRNPWKRSYSKHKKAYWEIYNDLCEKVKQKHPYNEGRRLLDVLDMSVFDFLTGNLDRHHYETFRDFGNNTFILHMDNGRAFGKSKYDCISCLAPVRQCCMIRLSTLTKLIKLYVGPDSLSQLMRSSLTSDPLNPVLVESHLDGLDRRVSKILVVLFECIVNGKHWDEVIIDDGVR